MMLGMARLQVQEVDSAARDTSLTIVHFRQSSGDCSSSRRHQINREVIHFIDVVRQACWVRDIRQKKCGVATGLGRNSLIVLFTT
jgi:hypothetical protein